jgi:hypothetical protein
MSAAETRSAWGLEGPFQTIYFAILRISRTCYNEVRPALFEMSALGQTISVLSGWNGQSDALSVLTSISFGTSRSSLVTSSRCAKGGLCLVLKRRSLTAFTPGITQHVRLTILEDQICFFVLVRPGTSNPMW